MRSGLIATGSEWSFDQVEAYERALAGIAADYRLDTYPNQIEIVSAEQMMDASSSVGMPVGYSHWSYGREFVSIERRYRRGEMGLAYEIVINSNPCIAYLMEENTLPMQALVIAHACFGHNSFFKGNYLFRTWTTAEGIIDYLLFARDYIRNCEQRHGVPAVEEIIDSCHALRNYGIDRARRPAHLSSSRELARQRARETQRQEAVNELWRTLPVRNDAQPAASEDIFPSESQENLLYFIEKNAPLLAPWQREIVRIVRKLAQYFYPQRLTQVMNEGWATFWHYTLLNRLYDDGRIDDAFMLEVLTSHTSVIMQPDFAHPHYSGINPYALGFSMMRDIRRICEQPTDEDRHWFPDLACTNWVTSLDFAMRNYKDESFIAQYLSPRLMREMRLFAVVDDDREETVEISAIHDEAGYRRLRSALAAQYDLANREPDIQVARVDRRGDRALGLRHHQRNRRPLSSASADTLRHVAQLWGFPVRLETFGPDGAVEDVIEVRPPR